MKIVLFALLALFVGSASSHHMIEDSELYNQVQQILEDVESPHAYTTEDDPSLVDLYAQTSTLEDVDYTITFEGDDITELLEAVNDLLVLIELTEDVIAYEVKIVNDMDTDIIYVTLNVDFEE